MTTITSTFTHSAQPATSISSSLLPWTSNSGSETGQKYNGNGCSEILSISRAGGNESAAGFSGLTKYQILQLTKKLDQQANYTRDMKKAAFRVFAALAANDEDIRKRIIETENLMECLVSSLDCGEGPSPHPAQAKLQMAAVQTLHSLSR